MIEGIWASVYVSFNLVQGGRLSCRECLANFDYDFADLRCDAASLRKELHGNAEEAYSDLHELFHAGSDVALRKLSNSSVRAWNPDSTGHSS